MSNWIIKNESTWRGKIKRMLTTSFTFGGIIIITQRNNNLLTLIY